MNIIIIIHSSGLSARIGIPLSSIRKSSIGNITCSEIDSTRLQVHIDNEWQYYIYIL